MSVSLDQAPSPGGLGQRAAAGAVWMTAQKWVTRVTGLATVAILTRVLAPADFGVVAAASTILPLVYLLAGVVIGALVVSALVAAFIGGAKKITGGGRGGMRRGRR